MLIYSHNWQLLLTSTSVPTHQKLLNRLEQELSRPASSLRLYYGEGNSDDTLIESDADLLGLKYIHRSGAIKLRVVSSIDEENRLIQEQVSISLNEIYNLIEEEEEKRALSQSTSQYLSTLYERVTNKIEEGYQTRVNQEIIGSYIGSMSNDIAEAEANKSLANFCLLRNRPVRKSRFSPSRTSQRRIDEIVERVLQKMVPKMVEEISSRIRQEIRLSGDDICDSHSLSDRNFSEITEKIIRSSMRSRLENPEQ